MAFVFVLLRYKHKLPFKPNLVVFLLINIILLTLVYISGINFESKTITERWELNLVGLKVFFDNFIIGVGPGNYLIEAQNYFFKNFNLRLFQPPHNFYILFLAEYGLIGLILIILLFKKIAKRFIYSQSLIKSRLLFPLAGAYSFGMLFDHYFLTQFQTSYILFVLVGLILAVDKMLDLK